MEDRQIIKLYWDRAEEAIRETDVKYGRLCQYIAQNILANPEDSEECVNDTWLGLWNAIPPQRPSRFPAFVGRITRNLALKRFDYLTAAKRSPEAGCSLEELGDCVSGRTGVEDELENRRIEEAIDAFLRSLDEEKRTLFIRRYWYFDSIENICRRTGHSQSKVKSILSRTRHKLRDYLEREGIEL